MTTININQLLFSRVSPIKKLDIVKNLDNSAILHISSESIARMIKEVGIKRGTKRSWDFYLSRGNRGSNNWNSMAESLSLVRGEIFISLYVQYNNTDTTIVERFRPFLGGNEYHGQVKGFDGYNDRYYYFIYNERDKANVLRGIIRQYIENKYASKLKKEAA